MFYDNQFHSINITLQINNLLTTDIELSTLSTVLTCIIQYLHYYWYSSITSGTYSLIYNNNNKVPVIIIIIVIIIVINNKS